MDVSPFPYQGPLDPKLVRGRDDLIADLVERVSEHRLTALLGPRRFGKTSVLRRVAADVAAAGTVVVWVDLYEVSSMADLAARFDMALAPLGAVDERIGRLAAGVELNLGLVRVELRKPASSRPDPLLTVHAQLDVITKLAAQTPVLLVFDEFAGINRVHGAAGLLRTHLQPHYTAARNRVRRIGAIDDACAVLRPAAAVLRAGRPASAIGPLARADRRGDRVRWVHGDRSEGRQPRLPHRRADRRPSPALDATRRTRRGGSFRRARPPTTTPGPPRWPTRAARPRPDWSGCTPRCQHVSATCCGSSRWGGSPFGAAAELFELKNGAAQHARQSLLDAGHLHADNGRAELVDPIFADWIRQRFPI